MPQRRPHDDDVPVLRAPTPTERVGGVAQTIAESLAEHPLAQLLDLLGLSDLQGVADTFTTPDSGERTAMAKTFGGGKKLVGQAGRAPGFRTANPSGRIPRGQQNVDAAAKIPRFRSPAGDFVKYEGEWWRIKPFRQDATDITLEYLGKGPQSVDAKILKSQTVSMRDFYDRVMQAKQTGPKRRE